MQDLSALILVPLQSSQGTSPGWDTCCWELPLLVSQWVDLLNLSVISENKVLTFRSGLMLKTSLHLGHRHKVFMFQYSVMQLLQKLCPHGVVTGSVNMSRQMAQRNCSFVSRQLFEDILALRGQKTKHLSLLTDGIKAVNLQNSLEWISCDCLMKELNKMRRLPV